LDAARIGARGLRCGLVIAGRLRATHLRGVTGLGNGLSGAAALIQVGARIGGTVRASLSLVDGRGTALIERNSLRTARSGTPLLGAASLMKVSGGYAARVSAVARGATRVGMTARRAAGIGVAARRAARARAAAGGIAPLRTVAARAGAAGG